MLHLQSSCSLLTSGKYIIWTHTWELLASDPPLLPGQILHPRPGQPVGGLRVAEHVLQGLEVSDEDGVETEGVHVHEPVLLMLLVHPPQCPHGVCASLAAKLVKDFENVVRLNLKDDLEQNYEQSNIFNKAYGLPTEDSSRS